MARLSLLLLLLVRAPEARAASLHRDRAKNVIAAVPKADADPLPLDLPAQLIAGAATSADDKQQTPKAVAAKTVSDSNVRVLSPTQLSAGELPLDHHPPKYSAANLLKMRRKPRSHIEHSHEETLALFAMDRHSRARHHVLIQATSDLPNYYYHGSKLAVGPSFRARCRV